MYILFWFFKQFYYILKRFVKHKLLLLFIFFFIALFIFIKPAFAFTSGNEIESIYGYYNGFSSSEINTINSLISQNKSDYDSFICRAYRDDTTNEKTVTIYFYNFTDIGYLYKTDINLSNYPYIVFRAQSSDNVNNSVILYSYNYPSFSFSDSGYRNTINTQVCSFTNSRDDFCLYTNRNIYTNNSFDDVFFYGGNKSLNGPYITTNSTNIINFSFNFLTINAHNLSFNDYYEMRFTYPNANTFYTGVIENYKTLDNGTLYFNIPKSWFTDDIVVRSGSRISFDLIRYHREGNAVTSETYSLGSFILDLTLQEQQEINEDSNKQLLSDISQNQQQTTQAVENLENTITDSNVDDSSIFLPTLEVNDPTQVGINNIFDLLYNAFTTGDAEDIILPFPFTNKTITIPGNLTYNVLHNNGGDILIRIIRAFWWYKIAGFIAFDVFSKLKSIQEGNIEDVQKENIKGDML